MGPLIGLAIIARNEARNGNLTRLLDSVGDAFDRVVLLDTGSTDATVELFQAWARLQPDMTYATSRFQWLDDFSAARNAADRLLVYGAIDELPNYGEPLVDWTSWADCDDTITSPQILHQLAERAPGEVRSLIFGYDYGQHPQTGECICHLRRERLVRVAHAGRWVGRVHEAQLGVEPAQYVPDELCHWRHHKQMEADGAPRSNRRNLKILRRWVEDEPANARVLAYLGTEHAMRGHHKTALGFYRRYMKLIGGWDAERAQVCRKYAASLMALDLFDQAQAIALEAITVMPEWPDSYLTLAEVALVREQPAKTLVHAQRVLDLGAPQTFLIINPFDYAVQPHRLFAHSYYKLGRFEEAVESARLVIEHMPEDLGIRGIYPGLPRADEARAHGQHVPDRGRAARRPRRAAQGARAAEVRPGLRHRPPTGRGDALGSDRAVSSIHSHEGFVRHYQNGGSKPEDFHGDDQIVPICEQLPRVRFLLEGLDEPATGGAMKPRRTHSSTQVIGLLGGNEDNDLWVDASDIFDDDPMMHSVWVPTDIEREQIAAGLNIQLTVHSAHTRRCR